jgi:hypothetical protein
LKELEQLKGQQVHIILNDDNSIFRWPYRFSEVENDLVQAWTTWKLLDGGLVELFKGEFALTIVISAKKNIFGN